MLPVSLRDVVNEMESVSEDWTAYLNRRTGELYSVTEEDRSALDEEDEAEMPEWQKEVLPKLRDIEASKDWLELPSQFDIHEYSIMERFCASVADSELRADLLDAIRGSGAFGRFKNMIHRRGIEEQWYHFRDEALAEIAGEWLEANGIAFTR